LKPTLKTQISSKNMTQSDYFNYDPKSVSRVTRFLWWCAGADQYFLMRSPKQDRVKYAGIGGIVLATGVLAVVSGGIAFRTAFGPKGVDSPDSTSFIFNVITFVFAFLWGLMIFNLDRFIVSSTGKGDGTDNITPKEFFQALPRLFIAFVLGITMSAPLEIQILKTEIDLELSSRINQERKKLDQSADDRFKKSMIEIEKDIAKFESDRNKLVEDRKAAEKEYIDQMQGRAGSAGYGPRAKQLEALKNEKAIQIEEYDRRSSKQLENLNARREKLIEDHDLELNGNQAKANKYDGLLARIDISHEIGGWVSIFITAMLFCIEMGPIFFKMMMTKGAYDYMVENFNLKQNIENGIIREEHLYEGKNGALLMEKYRYLHVEAIQKEKEDALEAQKDLTGKIIGSWKNAKLKELDETPANFYKTLDL
jgi:hypothetical protein